MLELKEYSLAEMAEALRSTAITKQAITRRLDNLPLTYTRDGRGNTLTFTIQSIQDPFKVYCILDLDIDSRADFKKLRNLFYYLFCVEGFVEMPMSEMEAWLNEADMPVSRKTISKWLNYLQNIDFIMLDKSDSIYYKIKKRNGQKIHMEIDRETYNKAWQIYFEEKKQRGSDWAYWAMYEFLGGHPYRKPRIVQNAFYQQEIEKLIDYVNLAFDE